MNASLIHGAQRALVVCAHTDDELGCAGTIVRLLEAQADVWYLALSRCEESVPEGFPQDVLEGECRECAARLGISEGKVMVERFPVRRFPACRQEILERMVELKRLIEPTLVLLPSFFDSHQDHNVVSWEGFRAFKHCTVLGYELPQNLIAFRSTAFVALTKEHLEKKIYALRSYVSQQFRRYASDNFVRSLATVRGTQCNSEYAEAFEVIRLIS